MSMRINTNIEAFNAQRNLSNTATAYAKSVEKLSSGLRINRAGDDAAGLSISEKLKAQVNGLGQAQRNAQDGISLIQTAEGALNETHSILQRMRELTVQAANDTLADSDRNAIKSEMGQLSSEVDRIAHSTQFNGKNLLDGSLPATKSASFVSGASGLGNLASSATFAAASASFGTAAAAGNYTFTVSNMGAKFTETGGTVSTATVNATETGTVAAATAASTADVVVNGYTINVHSTDSATTLAGSLDAQSATTGVHVTMNAGKMVFTSVAGGSAGTQPTISSTDNSVLDKLGITSTETTFTSGTDQNTSTTAGTLVLSSQNGTATIAITRGETATAVAAAINAANIGVTATFSGGKLSLTDNQIGNFSITVSQTNSSTQVLSDFKLTTAAATTTAGADVQATMSLNGGASTTMSYSVGANTLAASGVTLDLTGMGTFEGSGAVAANNSFSLSYKDDQANLQIGANAQQTLSVGIEDMSAHALGVDTLDVSSATVINGNDGLGDGKNADGSLGTLAKIDQAIASVSNQRSTLGAYQNRLEHTISNLGVAQENLTASESRIVDVDMAAEMVNFTKTGILQQAGQAILAQANQAPQGVLSLLRG